MKLSRTEVCKRVPMSLATFDRWRKAGKLETFTDGTLSNAKKLHSCSLSALRPWTVGVNAENCGLWSSGLDIRDSHGKPSTSS